MALADDFILGSGLLHQRFRVATEILGAIASEAPGALTISQLAEVTGRTVKEITKLCTSLERAALLRAAPLQQDGWTLAIPASAITLEDVFRCVLDMQTARHRSGSKTKTGLTPGARDLDLLLMQATMAINQSVFKHLRQFSLDRLKARASSVGFGALRLPRSRYDDNPDLALMV